MSNKERPREIQISYEDDMSYHERQFWAVVREMYESGNYNSRYVPERRNNEGRIVKAVHVVAFDAGETAHLYELIPGQTDSEKANLAKLLKSQLVAYDVSDVIDGEIINTALKALKDKGLHVIGGFQLGTFDSGVRSAEIIYPEIFAELTGSNKLAADISAILLMSAQESAEKE